MKFKRIDFSGFDMIDRAQVTIESMLNAAWTLESNFIWCDLDKGGRETLTLIFSLRSGQ